MESSLTAEIYISDTVDPRFNLALEDLLFERTEQTGAVIMYLWQNQNTVVIGKSQNAWREVRTELLEQEGGTLVRRTSGGGAVFHDLGNLCFTFIAPRDEYERINWRELIAQAVRSFGIDAALNGRNDIVAADGRKFSGNAFRFTKQAGMMHGTLLVDADLEKMGRYLNVSPAKLEAKGVSSVRSRVVNLKELSPVLTIPMLSDRLTEAFCRYLETRGASPKPPVHVNAVCTDIDAGGDTVPLWYTDPEAIGGNDFYLRYQRFASWEWRYGQSLPFNAFVERRFGWGTVSAGLFVENGVISRAEISTDAMDAELGEVLSNALSGVRLSTEDLHTALAAALALLSITSGTIAKPAEVVEDMTSLLAGI